VTDVFLDRYGTGSRPPTWPLVLSVVGVAAAAVLAFVGQPTTVPSAAWYGVGWAAGALVPMASVVSYRLRLRTLSTRPDFSYTRRTNRAIIWIVALGTVVGAFHGYHFALWVAT
jgi:hypothetical protein